MAVASSGWKADVGQKKRAEPVRARSHASREAIMQAAMALWRTKGFGATTVTDICKAAGVSKALFYVYFARREDVLLEVEVFTMRDAHEAARAVTAGGHALAEVITVVVDTLATRSKRFPPDLVFETILETYRLEQRVLNDGGTEADIAHLFLEPFEQAQQSGEIAVDVDVPRAARVAQIMVTDALRCWAATGFGEELRLEALAAEITGLVATIRKQ